MFVYAAGSNANAAPIATISGSDTTLIQPIGVALDSSRKIYVADESAASVYVYSAVGSRTGLLNVAPVDTINGPDTGLLAPVGIAVDSSRQNLCDGLCGLRACLSIRPAATATPLPPTPSPGSAPS